MIDPLTEVVTLLQPQAHLSKLVGAVGAWRVSRHESGQAFYCAVLNGGCSLTVDDAAPVTLEAGDFVLIPAAHEFTLASLEPGLPPEEDTMPTALADGTYWLGPQNVPAEVQLLVGHCSFGSPDAALLVSLLPQVVQVRGQSRLAALVHMVWEESRARRPARDVVLVRLLEVLLIEALRSTPGSAAQPGLMRGLADHRLAVAIRCMHENYARPWTVAQLAKEAALSRSVFFERFSRALGVTPMEYLLAWRMALAKQLLRRSETNLADIAARIGYGSASAFSVAFARHAGLPPGRYARLDMAP